MITVWQAIIIGILLTIATIGALRGTGSLLE